MSKITNGLQEAVRVARRVVPPARTTTFLVLHSPFAGRDLPSRLDGKMFPVYSIRCGPCGATRSTDETERGAAVRWAERRGWVKRRWGWSCPVCHAEGRTP